METHKVKEHRFAIKISINYMWEYSPDLIKLEKLKEKKQKYDQEIADHKKALSKLEATFKQVSALI